MARDAKVLDVLIASPSDVAAERIAIEEVVRAWNSVHSKSASIMLNPVRWETDVFPEMGDRPQEIVNRQIVDQADILIGAFWTKLGTPTGEAASGTVEEITRCLNAGKPVMLYFSDQPVAPDSIDLDALSKLRSYRDSIWKQGIASTYRSVEDLREKLTRHLAQRINEIAARLVTASRSAAPAERRRNDHNALGTALVRQLTGIQAQWIAERDAYKDQTQDTYRQAEERKGRDLLDQVGQLLTTAIAAPVIQSDEPIMAELRSLLARCREVQKIRLFMDGGMSWRALWQGGEELINEVMKVFAAIRDGREA